MPCVSLGFQSYAETLFEKSKISPEASIKNNLGMKNDLSMACRSVAALCSTRMN
jgi:hypothetical protein